MSYINEIAKALLKKDFSTIKPPKNSVEFLELYKMTDNCDINSLLLCTAKGSPSWDMLVYSWAYFRHVHKHNKNIIVNHIIDMINYPDIERPEDDPDGVRYLWYLKSFIDGTSLTLPDPPSNVEQFAAFISVRGACDLWDKIPEDSPPWIKFANEAHPLYDAYAKGDLDTLSRLIEYSNKVQSTSIEDRVSKLENVVFNDISVNEYELPKSGDTDGYLSRLFSGSQTPSGYSRQINKIIKSNNGNLLDAIKRRVDSIKFHNDAMEFAVSVLMSGGVSNEVKDWIKAFLLERHVGQLVHMMEFPGLMVTSNMSVRQIKSPESFYTFQNNIKNHGSHEVHRVSTSRSMNEIISQHEFKAYELIDLCRYCLSLNIDNKHKMWAIECANGISDESFYYLASAANITNNFVVNAIWNSTAPVKSCIEISGYLRGLFYSCNPSSQYAKMKHIAEACLQMSDILENNEYCYKWAELFLAQVKV